MIAERLKPGDKIAFVCPSSYLKEEKIELVNNAIKVIESLGLKVVWGKNAKNIDKYGLSAGTPEERAEDINNAFKDYEIKAIWCITGGDTANQTLELLDYNMIKENPKIFMGLSDNTVLINAIYKKTGLITIHGTDAKTGNKDGYFNSEFTHNEFKKRLMDNNPEIGKTTEWKCIREGKAKGKIIGGNLRCFLKLTGTEYMPDVQDKIMLIEGYSSTIKEAIANITRLKTMGIFDKIKGIIVGYFYAFDKEEKLDKNGNRIFYEDLLKELTSEYDFPILKIYEFGHKCHSNFLPIGCLAEMDSKNKTITLLDNFLK